jgi:hypothetical protein
MSTDSGSSSCCGVGSDSEDGRWGPCLGTAAARLARGRPPRAGSAPGPAPQLLFDFQETASPHVREPLTERVAQLAEGFPGLHTLRSADLHPSSYLAVAWCAATGLRCVQMHGQDDCMAGEQRVPVHRGRACPSLD